MVGGQTINEERERLARRLGWDSYDDAPHIVQNNIDAKLEGIDDDPFWMLRRPE